MEWLMLVLYKPDEIGSVILCAPWIYCGRVILNFAWGEKLEQGGLDKEKELMRGRG